MFVIVFVVSVVCVEDIIAEFLIHLGPMWFSKHAPVDKLMYRVLEVYNCHQHQ